MSKLSVYSRNAVYTWAGYGGNLVVLLLLSPFVVRTLGDRSYGVWTMLMGLAGYLGLAELGVRVSTGRFINYYLGRRDTDTFNRVIVTSLLFYGAVGVVIVAVTTLVAWLGQPLLAKLSPDIARVAHWVLPLLGINVALGFFAATYGQILQAANRFDVQTWADMGALAVRAIGTAAVLCAGGSLTALACVNIATSLAGLFLRMLGAHRYGPQYHLRARFISASVLREVMGFGAWSFISNTAALLIHYTDGIVIGLILGPECVTVYAIGLMLVEHGRRVVYDGVGVISPDVFQAAARNDRPLLHLHMVSGTRAALAIAIPLLSGYLVFGEQFLNLWMGPNTHGSYRVLFILTLSLFGGAAARPAINALTGLGCVRFLAFECIAEGLINLGLSIYLVKWAHWGVEGVAYGTIIPMFAFNNVLVPAIACRRTGLRVWRYFADTAARWLPAVLLTVLLAMAIRAVTPGNGWATFALRVAMLLTAYLPVAWTLVLGSYERAHVLQTAQQFLRGRGVIAPDEA